MGAYLRDVKGWGWKIDGTYQYCALKKKERQKDSRQVGGYEDGVEKQTRIESRRQQSTRKFCSRGF